MTNVQNIGDGVYFPNADTNFIFRMKDRRPSDPAVLPVNCTGMTFLFIMRDHLDNSILYQVTGSDISLSDYVGTKDQVNVRAAKAKTVLCAQGRTYSAALWRTDVPTQSPCWAGDVVTSIVAALP